MVENEFCKFGIEFIFMKSRLNIIIGLIVLTLASCSTGYNNDGNGVYYKHWNEGSGQHEDKIDANPKTFKVLQFDKYAKDDKRFFMKDK
jgi:hypothetical protein